MNTKQKILDKALQMFNERGIEYVGLRELASILDMRVSNITYYFPTKDDLVFEIAQLLREKNSTVMIVNKNITMLGFLQMMQEVFKHHFMFRCLMLSFVHIVEQNKRVAASYKKTQSTRNETLQSNIDSLEISGFLQCKDAAVKEFLVSSIALISRFWISEATISFRQMTDEAQSKHYLVLIARLLLPYSTVRGKNQINKFIEKL